MGTRDYSVDESGDAVLFNQRGQVIVGQPGCSSHFAAGLLQVGDLTKLTLELDTLRRELVADPYFRRVRSMSHEAKKTAFFFHAKDDCPEVRREVFRVLAGHELRFYAIVRDKLVIAEKVRAANVAGQTYRYNPNDLYDVHVRRLFEDRLHPQWDVRACFARRGTSDRTAALKRALVEARGDFEKAHGLAATSAIEVSARSPQESAGLQAVDYFLWSLQRVYTRKEDRYLEYLYTFIELIHDMDAPGGGSDGVFYNQENKLDALKIKGPPGI